MTETSTQTAALYMVQMWLDPRRLAELARALHLPLRQASSGYLVHCALRELFGPHAPAPFCLQDELGRHIRVLGYARTPRDRLQAVARECASPMVYETLDWTRMCSKPMPEHFARGLVLSFELRACPVVRMSSAGKHHSARVEVDAFLARVWELDDPSVPIRREDVYRDWLAHQFRRRGGAILRAAGLRRFSLERMLRRTRSNGRKSTVIKRPAATLAGELEVADSARFGELLRRGIGRHKSFGFGMLKVRPCRR